jgi:molecular chaperone DnaK (HSP70)
MEADGSLLLGQAAFMSRIKDPVRFKAEFKRDLGQEVPYVLGEKEYLPQELFTEILVHFKREAEKSTGQKIDKAIITHPANYGRTKQRLLEQAAQRAGLYDVILLDEPTAAAMAYCQKGSVETGELLLVYDLGGGTFDVALIKRTTGGFQHMTEPWGYPSAGHGL